MAQEAAPFSSVLGDLERSGSGDAVSAGDVLEAFEHRSLGVLLTVFGLIAALPIIGDIPGASIATGTLILAAVVQSLAGRGSLWLPGIVRRRRLERAKLERAVEKAGPWVRRVDRLLKPRLTSLIAGPAQRRLVSVAAGLLAVSFYPLAFVPFGVNAPAIGVIAFGLGLLACDGLLVLLGYACSAATAYILVTAL